MLTLDLHRIHEMNKTTPKRQQNESLFLMLNIFINCFNLDSFGIWYNETEINKKTTEKKSVH